MGYVTHSKGGAERICALVQASASHDVHVDASLVRDVLEVAETNTNCSRHRGLVQKQNAHAVT